METAAPPFQLCPGGYTNVILYGRGWRRHTVNIPLAQQPNNAGLSSLLVGKDSIPLFLRRINKINSAETASLLNDCS